MYRLALALSLIFSSGAEASAPALPESVRYKQEASSEWQSIESKLDASCSPEINLLGNQNSQLVAEVDAKSCRIWVSSKLDNSSARAKCDVLVQANKAILELKTEVALPELVETDACAGFSDKLPVLSVARAKKIVQKATHQKASHCKRLDVNLVQCKTKSKRVAVLNQSSGYQVR